MLQMLVLLVLLRVRLLCPTRSCLGRVALNIMMPGVEAGYEVAHAQISISIWKDEMMPSEGPTRDPPAGRKIPDRAFLWRPSDGIFQSGGAPSEDGGYSRLSIVASTLDDWRRRKTNIGPLAWRTSKTFRIKMGGARMGEGRWLAT